MIETLPSGPSAGESLPGSGDAGLDQSGLPALDQAARAVLELLKGNAQLKAIGLQAERVNWTQGVAEFVFRAAGREETRRVSVHGLIDVDHGEVADSLVYYLGVGT